MPRGGVPLYLSEYGYQTNPPDRIGVSLARQAAYLAQAEYMAWRTPAVRAWSQYLLYDNGDPISKTFQTGLLFADGREKPSYQGYKLPIWLPKRRVARHGSALAVWGMARPAPPARPRDRHPVPVGAGQGLPDAGDPQGIGGTRLPLRPGPDPRRGPRPPELERAGQPQRERRLPVETWPCVCGRIERSPWCSPGCRSR